MADLADDGGARLGKTLNISVRGSGGRSWTAS
jgi:hypothetical protein